MNGVVTLSIAGLSAQEGTVVNVAANLLAALDQKIELLANGDLTGDIILVSGGSAIAQQLLAQPDSRQRVLVFVDEDNRLPEVRTVVRPVRVQTLRDALAELIVHIPERRARPAAAQIKSSPAVAPLPASTAPLTLPGTLYYLLLDAVLQRAMVRVDCDGGTTLLVHGPSQTIYTRAEGMSIERMAQQDFTTLKSTRLAEADFMQASKGMSLTRLHDVLWLAGRYGGRGQLLPGHSLDEPVHLKVWPKFNNRHVRPENLKLAALLSKQPVTLRWLAESSGVPLPQVIDFYNAAVAFGVIEKSKAASAVPLSKPAPSGGLLSRIARRLALKRD